MFPPSVLLNNPFLDPPPQNPWHAQRQWLDGSESSPDSATPVTLPAMPLYGPPHQYHPVLPSFDPTHPPRTTYQSLPTPGLRQQVFAPQGCSSYPPAPPPAAYPQQQSYVQEFSRQQFLPCHLPPPFVAPRVPEPPRYSVPPLYTPYRNTQIPASASQVTPAELGPVPKVFPLSTVAWKDGDKLSHKQDNWREYSMKVENQLGMIPGAVRFLDSNEDDPNDCPLAQLYPAHHCAWIDTDRVVRAFRASLNDTLTITERMHVAHCTTASEMWSTVRYRHLVWGPAGQISALKRFANISYASDPKTFTATTTLLTQCNEAIWQCGPPNPELFLLSSIVSALEEHHGTISSMLLAQPNLNLAMALAMLEVRQCRPTGSGGEVFAASVAPMVAFCTNKVCPSWRPTPGLTVPVKGVEWMEKRCWRHKTSAVQTRDRRKNAMLLVARTLQSKVSITTLSPHPRPLQPR
ncbi:hypothetical protein B0H13DRAFT_1929449 [Mycena leptocephala]|nr:hypothetical protein B0H13DRAFT_1929449 [Mycena leptocephala]